MLVKWPLIAHTDAPAGKAVKVRGKAAAVGAKGGVRKRAFGSRGGAAGQGKKRVSATQKAGLIFPVPRVRRYLKDLDVADRIGAGESRGDSY